MKMKIKEITTVLFALSLLTDCSRDYDLERTIFFPDPEFPDLPMYTEWGYNTFGAYYDRQVFKSTNDIVPLKVIVRNDSTFFRFSGMLNNYKEMSVTFTMNDFLPDVYNDLTQLDKKILDLRDPKYGVIIKIDGQQQEMILLGGSLEFKKAQNLIVDQKEEEIILSGTFEFQIVINDEPFTVSRGRFDQGISYDNFFRFYF